MNMEMLSYWLRDLVSPILLVDDRLFIDRREVGLAGMQQEIAKYDSLDEAQRWINIFPVADFVNAFVFDDYENADEDSILAIFETSWSYQIRARYPDHPFSISRWSDDDAGDFGLWLKG